VLPPNEDAIRQRNRIDKGGENMKATRFLIGVALACLVAGAAAQTYPSKPVRLISPYPPGGGTDAVARVIAQALSEQLGQQFVVDTRGGASGLIGTEVAARSPADGYTLVLGNVAPLAILPVAMTKLPYNPIRDFSPISLLALSDYVLVVHPSVPAKSVREIIALAKARPGGLTYASSGNLGAPHMAGELLNLLAKVNIVHIPYKGNGPAAIAVMTGETTMMFGTGPSVVPHIKTGRIRALATTGSKRSMPDLPAMSELLPGYNVTQWYGLLAPAGTPKGIINQLHTEVVKAIASTKVAQLLVSEGTQPISTTPDEFQAFIKAEMAKWDKVVKTANIKAD
jgi:tripartite-type tricarboxylate transporter receptor subunit TctC